MGEAFAKLLGNGQGLTNFGVQQAPGGPTQYVNPAAMGRLVGADSAAATMPGRSTIDGNLALPTITTTQQDPGAYSVPMAQPRPDLTSVTQNPDPTTAGFTAPPVGQQPIVSHPSFDPIMHPEQLSTKGKLLDALMQGGIGAANSPAATSEALARSGGRVNPGIGPGLAAARISIRPRTVPRWLRRPASNRPLVHTLQPCLTSSSPRWSTRR